MSGEDATLNAQRETALLAFKHIDEVSEHQREQVLLTLIDVLPEAEAEKAERALFYLRENRKAQFELALALDAYGSRDTNGNGSSNGGQS